MQVFFLENPVLVEILHNLFPHFIHHLHHPLLDLFLGLVEFLVYVRFEKAHEHKFELLPGAVERVVTLDKQERVDRLQSKQPQGQLQHRGLWQLCEPFQ